MTGLAESVGVELLGIASVKRQQGLFQGTMVAQGAFSVYRTEALGRAGGWPDRIGEDIVLTWAMMREAAGSAMSAPRSPSPARRKMSGHSPGSDAAGREG